MLTGITEQDWSITLAVFDAAQSSQGEPGLDDRKFLEAVHYFTVHSITWRALPADYGKGYSVWKRFWRLSRSRVFEAFFQLLAECSQTAHLILFFDSATARAHVSAAGAKGGQLHHAFGRSRGGFSTKIHLKTDLDGLPLDFHRTGGQASDSTQFEISLDIGPDIRARIAMTEQGIRQRCQPRRGPRTRHHRGHPAARELQAERALLPGTALQTEGTRRTDDGQAEAVQTRRHAVRKDR